MYFIAFYSKVRAGSEKNHHTVRGCPVQYPGGIHSVHAFHKNIQKHQIIGIRLQCLQKVPGTAEFVIFSLKIIPVEKLPEQVKK